MKIPLVICPPWLSMKGEYIIVSGFSLIMVADSPVRFW